MQPQPKTLNEYEPLQASARSILVSAMKYSHMVSLPEGYWHGENLCHATLTSEYVFLRQALGLELETDKEPICRYLFGDQLKDGSWAIAPEYPGDVSTTTEAYLALKIMGIPIDDPRMRRAREFALHSGGVAKVRIFTRIFLAQFGLFPWDAVPQIPTELVLLPPQFPVNIYTLSSWARSFMVPLTIIRHHRPIYALPNGVSKTNDYMDELWCDASNKMVSYTPSLWQLWNTDRVAFLFTVIDKALFSVDGWFPTLRSYSRRKCLDWILEHQEATGEWQGFLPPIQFSILALLLEGYELKDDRIVLGLEAVERLAWQDEKGKRYQACSSNIWDTALMVIALCDSGAPLDSAFLSKPIAWLKSWQASGPAGDWRVYRPNLPPGGWNFSTQSTWYPDVDDTAAVMLAILKQDPESATSTCIMKAANWILGMQNRDGGFGAFDVDNDSLFLNKIPFSDMKTLCDPSWACVSGRVLEIFGLLLHSPHKGKLQDNSLPRMKLACARAVEFLASTDQRDENGAWYGRWGANYIYGTSNVLCGLEYFVECPLGCVGPKENCAEHLDYPTHLARSLVSPAISFLKSCQNADGGWGECLSTYRDTSLAGKGRSGPSQTAWAIMALLGHLPPGDEAIVKGVEWLVREQVDMGDGGKGGTSWNEEFYTGVGFPNFYFLGYDYYRHYFPMMALGRWSRRMEREGGRAQDDRGVAD
ncbi:MAG: hypothetical protein M1839_004345 [Geoglossum umbratile]|nr:MAG: hypothetical protein M1839_004345 [Geoglossum umbratile]